MIEQEEADDWEKEVWEVEGDNLVSKEKLRHWSKDLKVEEVVEGKVEKKEAIEGKVNRVGGGGRLDWGVGGSGGEGRMG